MAAREQVDAYIERVRRDIKGRGFFLNPDETDLRVVVEGVLDNRERLGYDCCPCRAPADDAVKDADIVCPCIYMYDDVADHGSCYCAMYVSEEIFKGVRKAGPIPERRPLGGKVGKGEVKAIGGEEMSFSENVWRCPVCGYLCAKEHPPVKCPICGVPRERFELFAKKS